MSRVVGIPPAIKGGMNTQEYKGLVLRFSTKSGTGNPATLHKDTCPVGKHSSRKVASISTDLEFHVADLQERGYTVKRCACCK